MRAIGSPGLKAMGGSVLPFCSSTTPEERGVSLLAAVVEGRDVAGRFLGSTVGGSQTDISLR